MKNFLKIFIFTIIIFLTPKVFAASQNVSQKIEATPNFGGGTYYATQPVAVPVPLYQNIGTRYNGKLSLIEFYLDNSDWSWNYNKTYTITLNMASEDWRNNFMGPQIIQCNCDGSQQSTSSSSYVNNTFRFVSYKTIKFNFKLGSTMGCKTKFRVYSGNTSSIAITGVSNYNLSSIVISDTTTAPTPTPVAPVPTATPSPGNQDIINNNNQNTQNIIDNQSQNTQDIINNNTQNTSDIIENNNQNSENIINNQNANTLEEINQQRQQAYQNCGNIIRFNVKKGYQISGGNSLVQNDNSYYSDDYVPIPSNLSRLTIKGSTTDNQNGYYIIVYDNSKNVIDFWYANNRIIYLPVGSKYFRISSPNSTVSVFAGDVGCVDSVSGVITDSSIDNKTGFFTNFNNDMHGLSDIITLPLSSIQSLTNTSCVALNLPIPFTNDSIDLPCMSQLYDNYAHDIYNLWQIVSFGIISYYICLDIFKMVKGFKDPNEDKIEVLDL